MAEFTKSGFAIGLTAVSADALAEWSMQKTQVGYGWRGVIQGVAGIGLGYLVGRKYWRVGAGLFTAGLFGLTKGGYREYRMRQYLAGAQPAAATGAAASQSSQQASGTPDTGGQAGSIRSQLQTPPGGALPGGRRASLRYDAFGRPLRVG
jgi:hypothetical protein